MPVNNVEKRMEGKGNPKEMKVADADPMTHIELELMDNMKRVLKKQKKKVSKVPSKTSWILYLMRK